VRFPLITELVNQCDIPNLMSGPGSSARQEPGWRVTHNLLNRLHPGLTARLHRHVDRPAAISLHANHTETLGVFGELQHVVGVVEVVEGFVNGHRE
jgi:hypothetical protein